MEQDEAAIRRVIEGVIAGWNRGSGSEFASGFATDADYVIVDGGYINGRETIAIGHQHLFDHVYKGSHNEATVEAIRFLQPNVATCRARMHLQFSPAPGVNEVANARALFVLSKTDAVWEIVTFQNTAIVPRGGDFAGAHEAAGTKHSAA